ncbi:MAG: 16S rRNA (uracil(1498)-N(3))-methyltransferase [Elusimicrobiaceae bacterium]|nr:16S rRNA (uracil(1498)-N(3))-methyltransferase [Elusimicrobiaceae bacterium]
MPQYFADIKETEFFLLDDEAHHAAVVQRHKEGDNILVFDGSGRQYDARIDKIQKNFVRGTLLKPRYVRRVSLEITLCFVPNSRVGLEETLDKCTQLGVSFFQPISSARSEYDVLKKYQDKLPRWQQIMLSACKQCNTPFLPKILPPAPFSQIISDEKISSLIAYEAEQTHTLSWGVQQLGNPKQLRVFIGPAGGWSEEEISLAATHRTPAVTLGVNILRAETACMAACAKML